MFQKFGKYLIPWKRIYKVGERKSDKGKVIMQLSGLASPTYQTSYEMLNTSHGMTFAKGRVILIN